MINPNEPAFPVNGLSVGMSIRAFISIQILAANIGDERVFGISFEERAKGAVECADALIAELNKQANTNI